MRCGAYRPLLAAAPGVRSMATTLAVEATSAPILARPGFQTLFDCWECESPDVG